MDNENRLFKANLYCVWKFTRIYTAKKNRALTQFTVKLNSSLPQQQAEISPLPETEMLLPHTDVIPIFYHTLHKYRHLAMCPGS